MSEKGGENLESKLTARVVAMTFMSVLIGAVIVLGIILAGVQIGRSYQASLEGVEVTEDDTVDIIGVKYEAMTISYNPGIEDGKGTATSYRTLLKKLGGEENYYYIKSQSQFDDAITKIKMLGGAVDVDGFELADDFFNSGSVILITAEKPGLSYFGVNSIVRDEKYHIHIDTSVVDANDTINVAGKAILIKIENIQPKYIEVKERAE